MKISILIIIILVFFAGCSLATDPTPQPSLSIEESKKDKAFLNVYQPQLPYLKLNGKPYLIKEAWVEHSHSNGNLGHTVLDKTYDFVMTFEEQPGDTINFKAYTRSLSVGNQEIWFFLTKEEFIKDTLVLNYKEKAENAETKQFLLFKKVARF